MESKMATIEEAFEVAAKVLEEGTDQLASEFWNSGHGSAHLKCSVEGREFLTVYLDRAPFGQKGYVVEVNWGGIGSVSAEAALAHAQAIMHASVVAMAVKAVLGEHLYNKKS